MCLVAVRIRPPLKSTDPGFDLIPQRFRESTCEVSTPTSLAVQSQQGKKLFVFDRVFDEDTEQPGIWEYLSDSITSFVQGYNVSILAYGQSGSGKSYTMGTSGPEEQNDPEIMGIVPRAAQALFEKLNGTPSVPHSGLRTPKRYSTQALPTISSLARANADKDWRLTATYVEIYNETPRDLLVSEAVPQDNRAQVVIREDTKGRIFLTGLTHVEINSVDDLLGALNFGSSIRQTDATAINARSSRSHAVFSLNLVQKKSDGMPLGQRKEKRFSVPIEALGTENMITIDSKLHFVDLAGSERLKNTGATGDRAKEGISINAGLASLGKVISQLSSKQPGAHISYRDSRLTRLLQDSLGGNAITYMVACVTPASFHLNETLNTLHYAQRARAIQSKPEIQQSHEDRDKQAAIDRLRAEVAFLRDQIRHTEHADRTDSVPGARSNRPGRKEAELQTQLMDMQENYNALSQRHARLIAEISKAREEGADTPMLKEAIGENAIQRLKRSNSLAETVDQVVMEYEKTIQSLESSLSKTRSTLSNSEETLMEKETRIAYMETIQQQLQTRIQKAMDREQSNEGYLRDLESRMEGSTDGEEKSAALVAELRKELARVRESENSAEDYISTLEERLAEAEQDHEIMQREIDRLEHVVERQRSIGRLDNLLSDLDSIRQKEEHAVPAPPEPKINGHREPKKLKHRESYDPFRPATPSESSSPELTDDEFTDAHDEQAELQQNARDDQLTALPVMNQRAKSDRSVQAPPVRSPEQNDFMADKLESMTQELFDLRSEHESVVTDYDMLQQKYQTALQTLAKLEYDKETPKSPQTPAASRPGSFLAGAGVKAEDKAMQEQPSSSRSLSAELSSHGTSSNGEEASRKNSGSSESISDDYVRVDEDPAQVPLPGEKETVHPELETLRKLHAEKEMNVAELTKTYQSLAEKHESTLQQMEDLRQEVQRSQYHMRPTSPSFMTKPVLRRKSDDMLGGTDRASRSFASLKNIALDNFEHNPDTRQSFELNLNTLMTELHGRSERMQSLEAELATVKKEMDAKQKVIAGLTRERSSLNKGSAGVDFSVVGQMRDQLMESEHQIRNLHEQHSAREKEFQDQIASLKSSLDEHQKNAARFADQLPTPRDEHFSHVPGDFPATPAVENIQNRELGARQSKAGATRAEKDGERVEDIARLQSELSQWETKHAEAMEAMQGSEARLLNTINDLEDSLRKMHESNKSPKIGQGGFEPEGKEAAALASIEAERVKHKEVVDALQREVDEYKNTANSHVSKLGQLEQSYASIMQQVDEDTKSRDLSEKELKTHRDLVANLENQLQVHKSAITIHQESLESLQGSHSREIDELKSSMESAEKESRDRHTELERHHQSVADGLQAALTEAQANLSSVLGNASNALGQPTDSSKLHTQIRGLVEEGKELHSRHLKTTNELKALQEELQNAMSNTVALENKIGELKMLNEESLLNLNKITEKERKSTRLVEELEEQLNSNYDHQQATTHRMSTLQTESVQFRQELERELEDQKMKNAVLEVSLLGQLRI